MFLLINSVSNRYRHTYNMCLEKLSRHVTGLVLVILEACTSGQALASAWHKKSVARVRLNFIKPEELISAKIVGRNINICYFKFPLYNNLCRSIIHIYFMLKPFINKSRQRWSVFIVNYRNSIGYIKGSWKTYKQLTRKKKFVSHSQKCYNLNTR